MTNGLFGVPKTNYIPKLNSFKVESQINALTGPVLLNIFFQSRKIRIPKGKTRLGFSSDEDPKHS